MVTEYKLQALLSLFYIPIKQMVNEIFCMQQIFVTPINI